MSCKIKKKKEENQAYFTKDWEYWQENLTVKYNAFIAYLECSSYIGEVGDATTNDEYFAIRVLISRHQAQNGLGILICLALAGGPRIFTIVGKLGSTTKITNGVTEREKLGFQCQNYHSFNVSSLLTPQILPIKWSKLCCDCVQLKHFAVASFALNWSMIC